jgi:hypothetical protein
MIFFFIFVFGFLFPSLLSDLVSFVFCWSQAFHVHIGQQCKVVSPFLQLGFFSRESDGGM